MGDGSIRVNRIQEDWRDLSDFWILNMHDNMNGKISSMRFSCNNKFFFSVGGDGNLFSYKWNLETDDIVTLVPVAPLKVFKKFNIWNNIKFDYYFSFSDSLSF